MAQTIRSKLAAAAKAIEPSADNVPVLCPWCGSDWNIGNVGYDFWPCGLSLKRKPGFTHRYLPEVETPCFVYATKQALKNLKSSARGL